MASYPQEADAKNIKQSLRLEGQASEFDLTIQAHTHREQRRSESLQLFVGYATEQLGQAIPGKQTMFHLEMPTHYFFLLIAPAISEDITICNEKKKQNDEMHTPPPVKWGG